MSESTVQPSSTSKDVQHEYDEFEVWHPRFNPWIIALTVTLATFMEALDTSIANVALPHIAGSLASSQDESTWVLTSYLVSNACVLPISGWISNRIGRKRFYMTCVALFTTFSLLCGLAPTLHILIFFRLIQGAAGGGLQPSERSILADTFPPERRSVAFSLYGMAVVLAPAIGPTVGGWITDSYTWRWIFFLNIPVGILSLILTSRIVEDPPYLKRKRKTVGGVDGIGLGLLIVTIGALQVMLDKGQEDDWFGSHFIILCAFIAGAGFIAFLYRELTVEHPIIDLSLYKQRNFVMTQIVMLMIGAALISTTVMIPQYLQELMGYTAEQAGLALSVGGLVLIVLFPIVGFIGQKLDPRLMITIGFIVVTLGILRLGDLDLSISFWDAASWRVIMVLGMPLLFVPISVMSFVGIPQAKNNEVSGLTALSRNIGGSLGISFITTLITRRSQTHQTYLAAHVNPASMQYQGMQSGLTGALHQGGYSQPDATAHAMAQVYHLMQQQARVLAYIDTAHILVLLTACLIPIGYLMQKPRFRRPAEPID
ncbi:MAG TPA: DHA2 family efflux MFS transporter permease subunit [Acidobacteriaceae bacterium]|jgi:DHA2 family multidrug resistance protein|nr:DHA2 family efflux MFS transporter permease subunit [Acidobacteriaceae bacterium]